MTADCSKTACWLTWLPSSKALVASCNFLAPGGPLDECPAPITWRDFFGAAGLALCVPPSMKSRLVPFCAEATCGSRNCCTIQCGSCAEEPTLRSGIEAELATMGGFFSFEADPNCGNPLRCGPVRPARLMAARTLLAVLPSCPKEPLRGALLVGPCKCSRGGACGKPEPSSMLVELVAAVPRVFMRAFFEGPAGAEEALASP